MRRFLVIQTAFIGDAILTLPLIQVLKKAHAEASVGVVAIPRTSELFAAHPAIERVHIFDKRGRDKGIASLRKLGKELREAEYDVAIIPHRSLRSALLAKLARIPVTIGFDRSAGWFLLTHTVSYDPKIHEVDRNLSLLGAIGVNSAKRELPELYPSSSDVAEVDAFLSEKTSPKNGLVGIAPGSVWKTKRWLQDRYVEVARRLVHEGFGVVLVGGLEDRPLCQAISESAHSLNVIVAAGRLSLLQSAELIRRCKVLLSNDSAPMHIALAMRTPVVAIFGSTVPEFGFAPYGEKDTVVETDGLACRPCSVHGRQRCPIKTFDCMKNISVEGVYSKLKALIT